MKPGRRRQLMIAFVALATALTGACSGDEPGAADEGAPDTAAAAESETEAGSGGRAVEPEELAAGADFYAVPDPLPDAVHGTLLRYQPLEGDQPGGGIGYRIMYLSESLEGEAITVTGTVIVPSGPPPADGFKLLTVAHGTTGSADECAPSQRGGAESALFGGAVEAGYVVATSDYEGMGTPGRHPYLVGPSEGRGVLDAALAARQIPGAEVGDRYAIVGYSQGGHGAAWAHELADEWAPELELVGSVAGAPPSEMQTIFTALAGTPISPDFFYLIVSGYAEAYPEADPSLVLTEAGMAVLDAVDEGCFSMGAAISGQQWADLVEPDAGSVEPWATLLDENDPGQVAVDHPLLIIHSAQDNIVPAALSEAMFNRLCDLGQVVERRVLPEGDHIGAAIAAGPQMFEWVEARMAGEPATSNCP